MSQTITFGGSVFTFPYGDTLLPGQRLNIGQGLISIDNSYIAIMQPDGNFVVYDACNTNVTSSALWATGTNGKGGNFLNYQTDGNLVVYTSSNSAVWASNTNGKNSTRIIQQIDGNFVIYNGNTPVWSINKSSSRQCINEKNCIENVQGTYTYSPCSAFDTTYCSSNPLNSFCQTVFKSNNPSVLSQYMINTCFRKDSSGNYPNITNPYCVQFMTENETLSESYLKDFCQDKMNTSSDDSICGCFYPETVYNSYYSTLASLYNIPSGLLDPQPACSFDKCVMAGIKPAHTCTSTEIVNCINKVNINNDGTIGGINISPSNECGITNTDSGGTTGPVTVNTPPGTTGVAVNTVQCTANSDCATNNLNKYIKVCSSNSCTYNKKTIAIITIVILIIIVSVVAMYS
jgi:hypothetical protein